MAAALFALVSVIWGSTWLAIKVGLVGVPPFLGAGLRFVVAALLTGTVLVWRGQRIRLSHDDWVCVLSSGILVFWLDYAGVYWAETHISSGLTAILFSTMPLMTALLGRFWIRSETLSVRKVAGILVGIAGTTLLFWPDERLGRSEILGMLAALGGSLAAAVNLVTVKRYGQRIDAFVLNFLGMGLGSACLLIMSAAMEDWSGVVWTPSNVAALLYLAVVGSVVAFTAYYRLIRLVDATVVSLTTLAIPVVALILGHVFLQEQVTSTAIAGIVVVLIGVGVTILPVRRRE
jgi:drug/metabolite transporter (DMT)-like permease